MGFKLSVTPIIPGGSETSLIQSFASLYVPNHDIGFVTCSHRSPTITWNDIEYKNGSVPFAFVRWGLVKVLEALRQEKILPFRNWRTTP